MRWLTLERVVVGLVVLAVFWVVSRCTESDASVGSPHVVEIGFGERP